MNPTYQTRMVLPAAALLIIAAAGCTEKEPLYCDKDTDCDPGYYCDEPIRTCRNKEDSGAKDATDATADSKADQAVTDSAPPDAGPGDVGGEGDLPPPCTKHKDCASGEFCGDGECLTWTKVASGVAVDLMGVWAANTVDVWAVGDNGTILRYDGKSWSQQSSGTTNTLRGVWGSSSTNVWAAGDKGTILHYDGSTWKTESSSAMGMFERMWGSSANDIYAVGEGAGVFRYDGSSWKDLATEINATGLAPHGVSGSSATDVWVVGLGGSAYRYDGGGKWTKVTMPVPKELYRVWSWSSSVAYVAGFQVTLSYDGSSWVTVSPGTSKDTQDVWGSSSGNVWLISCQTGEAYNYDGVSWSTFKLGWPVEPGMPAIHGTSASDVWIVGPKGKILHSE